jgi:hypothetical protein
MGGPWKSGREPTAKNLTAKSLPAGRQARTGAKQNKKDMSLIFNFSFLGGLGGYTLRPSYHNPLQLEVSARLQFRDVDDLASVKSKVFYNDGEYFEVRSRPSLQRCHLKKPARIELR